MSDDNPTGNGQAPATSRRGKSPGRVAAMARINALGLRGVGGRTITHGWRTLEERIRRGEEMPGAVGMLLREKMAGVIGDLGGLEACSTLEQGLARRVGEAELKLAAIEARFLTPNGQPRRMTRREQQEWTATWCRVTDTYARLCTALGTKRRPKPVPDLGAYLQEHYGPDGKAPERETADVPHAE